MTILVIETVDTQSLFMPAINAHLRPFTHYIILQNAIFPSSHAVHVSVSQIPNLGSANLPA